MDMYKLIASRYGQCNALSSMEKLQRITLCCAAIVFVVSCSLDNEQAKHAQRSIDKVPEKIQLKNPLPPGIVEAFFTLNTGSDQMLQQPKEAGLVVVVRLDVTEYRQTISSCTDPGLGSALGGGTERELEVAICNGEYWLVTEPGTLSVIRMDKKPEGESIFHLKLPKGVTAVRPRDK
jgi:hypothetical protein